MQELVQTSRKPASHTKERDSLNDTPAQSLSLTLPVLSTLNEKDCNPFWNPRSAEIQSILSLPIKTESQDPASRLFNTSLNRQEDLSKFLIKKIKHETTSILKSLSVSLPHSAIPNTGKDQQKDKKIIATKKIRIYPQNEVAYLQAIALYRRAYNIAVEMIKDKKNIDKDGKFINLRPFIKEITKQEQEEKNASYNSIIVDNAVLSALTTFKNICKKNKENKEGNQIGFKSRKGRKHSFSIDRLPKGLSPCLRALGRIHVTESVPDEAINKTCVITRDKGRWFIQVQQHISLESEIQGEVKCVGVDPGVRTFATCFSDKEVITAGDNVAKDQLIPMMKRVDRLIGKKQGILNSHKGTPFLDMPQWARDRIRHYDKCIERIMCKKDDIVLDLHNRLAHDLVTHYDVIFLPSFETSGMVKKSKKASIRRTTKRQMLSLNHYQFKLRLKWYAKKYGKHVVDCNEAYTSKTRSWDGTIDDKLGSSKTIKGSGFTVDRDVNGARNIFIKCLSRVA